MLVSVIIPHLNQEDSLAVCLASLHDQVDVEGVELEIIVVDNGSHRAPTELCSRWGDVHLLAEQVPGPGPARNCGVSKANGELLAFIDADCRAGEGWIASIVAELSLPKTPIVGGDVQVGYETPGKPTFIEPYENIYSYRNHEHIRDGFSGTGNLATFPEVMADVGPFGGIEISEDRDWGLRAGQKGYAIKYVPEMIVYHPARKSFAELAKKWERHIAHDYEVARHRRFGTFLWMARAILIAGSPILELRTIALSDRVSGVKERLFAFLCLVRVRLYRARRMIKVALEKDQQRISSGWNRK